MSGSSRKELIDILKDKYREIKPGIEKRLLEFKKIADDTDKEIFGELCFCILTPQSKAFVCDAIIADLKKTKLLYEGDEEQIRPYVKKARFYKNKTRYIIEARANLSRSGRIKLKEAVDFSDPAGAREWLVKNIKGIGYKEASHFLRNIGLGESLAILDIHILRKLFALGVISEVPKSLTKQKYLQIEAKMKTFSGYIGIPLAHMDLLFWSMAAGRIFK
jgi:N-glycosylase/DNA lyase